LKYLIREKIFSFGDNFTIKDEFDNDVFFVRGKVFSLGDKLTLEDALGNEVVYIEQKLFKFLPEYSIFLSGKYAARVKKEFSFFRPKFYIDSNMGQFTIDGDIFSHNFQILKNGIPIAMVSKQFFAFSDAYGVDISDNEDQDFILALVIVLDQVLHDDKNNR